MQHIVIIQTHSPFNQAKARESLDLILALAAVDYTISILFADAGVYQLLPPDTRSGSPLKVFQKSFGLFQLYDINNCFVCSASLAARDLLNISLPEGFRVIETSEIQQVLAAAQHIIRC